MVLTVTLRTDSNNDEPSVSFSASLWIFGCQLGALDPLSFSSLYGCLFGSFPFMLSGSCPPHLLFLFPNLVFVSL